MDALKRQHQCATIQLDFQLPQRFNLTYQAGEAPVKSDKTEKAETTQPTPAKESKEKEVKEPQAKPAADTKEAPKNVIPPGHARPVMIHRAILGSFERFLGILTEHFKGKWPLWLSPRQILVVPVMPAANDYCVEVQKIFKALDYYVDVDIGANTMPKKVRTGQLLQYNYIFVLGAKEMETKAVSIRVRDSKGELTVLSLDEAIKVLSEIRSTRSLTNDLPSKEA